MGKKKEKLRNLFKESIDPHFTGSFNVHASNSADNVSSTNISSVSNKVTETVNHKTNENTGFQTFISSKLTAYLDEHIKEVNRPVAQNEFFANKLESIRLFSGSDLISEEKSVETVQQKPPKKKRKKEKQDAESFKEVAVSFEWLQKQAQILKS